MISHLQAEHRCDYVKFLFRGPLDLCEQWKLRFIETIAAGEEYDGSHSGYVAKPLRKGADGLWTYVFEIYGPLAQVVTYFDWDAWSPHLERFDVKFDLGLSTEGVKSLRSHLETYGAGGRNVQTFNSRVRTKEDGRDGGGFGIAVGSHKSDLRFSAYKRGNENGGVEFQVRGARVKNGVSVTNMLRQEGKEEPCKDPWAEFEQHIFTMAQTAFKKDAKLTWEELTGILTEEPVDSTVEKALRVIEGQLDKLDKTALEVVRALVQEQLTFDF